jgi:hypothetical protein
MLLGATVACIASGVTATSTSSAHPRGIPEVPAPWLDDIALAAFTSSGPVIFINPTRCREVGPNVCSFFREHEQAHIRLGHGGPYYTSMASGRALAEAEADCWAARNALLGQVKATISFFETPPRATTDVGDHGTGLVRAKRLRSCRGI